MIENFARARVVVLLTTAALVVAACDSHTGALTLAQSRGASASVLANGGAIAFGTDEAIEDAELAARVREAIFADPRLRSQRIEVQTEDAAVKLTGTVDLPSLRERAVELAGAVDGVAQVQDRLEVRD